MIKQNIKEWAVEAGCPTAYALSGLIGINMKTAYRIFDDEDYIPREPIMRKLHETFGWQPGYYLYAVNTENSKPEETKENSKLEETEKTEEIEENPEP